MLIELTIPTLILCEKESVARSLAQIFTSRVNEQDHIRIGTNSYIVWCNGHLLSLAEPEYYDKEWKKWSWHTLPMLPKEKKFHWQPRHTGARALLSMFKRLSKDVKIVVNACDPGREGELIFREIWNELWMKTSLEVERIRIFDSTLEGLSHAWSEKIADNVDLRRIAEVGAVRQKADWLVGMNGSRAATLALPLPPTLKSWTLGRVQTAVLGMVAARTAKVINFKPDPYGSVFLHCSDGVQYAPKVLVPKGVSSLGNFTMLFEDTDQAEDLAKNLKEVARKIEWKVKDSKVIRKMYAPSLFDLTGLQRFMNHTFGWSARYTLEMAQKAYEFGFLSYPRTESEHLPKSMLETIQTRKTRIWTEWICKYRDLPLDAQPWETVKLHDCATAALYKYTFDDKKVTDHHAIITTDQWPDVSSSTPEVLLWKVVATRMLIHFEDPVIIEELTRWLSQDVKLPGYFAHLRPGDILPIQARIILADTKVHGWTTLASLLQQDMLEEALPVATFPITADTVLHHSTDVYIGRTKSPEPFNEGLLLGTMAEKNLGTPATRAAILEELFDSKYLYRDPSAKVSQRVTPTPEGRRLVEELEKKGMGWLCQPELTGGWEEALKQLEAGKSPLKTTDTFLDNIIDTVTQLVRALEGTQLHAEVICPVTRKPVEEKGQFYIFQGYPKVQCPKLLAGRKMSAKDYYQIFVAAHNGGGPFQFMSRKSGKKFSAYVVYIGKKDKDFEFKFS